jgi:hypothetical protein
MLPGSTDFHNSERVVTPKYFPASTPLQLAK